MKKLLVVLLALLLAVTMLAVAGCGGDTGKAKEYMKEADAASKKLLQTADKLDESSSALISAAMTGETAAIDTEALKTLPDEMDKLIAQVSTVRKEYEKILPLKGVDDYVEYATLVVQALTAEEAILKFGKELYAKLAPAIEQMVTTGDVSALSTALQESSESLSQLDELQTAADKAFEEAEKYKTDKNL